MKLIAFAGKLGSGKTFAAQLLIDRLNLHDRAIIKSFATRLKQIVAAATGVELKHLYSNQGKNTAQPLYEGATLGQLAQRVGRLWRSEFGNDIFIRTTLGGGNKEPEFVFIDDVRTQAEFKAVREAGGFLIRLEGDPCHVRKTSTRDLNDATEIELDDVPHDQWDAIVMNDAPANPDHLFATLMNQQWIRTLLISSP